MEQSSHLEVVVVVVVKRVVSIVILLCRATPSVAQVLSSNHNHKLLQLAPSPTEHSGWDTRAIHWQCDPQSGT